MEKEKKICGYKNAITDWKCPYEALEDSKEGFCIFHERRKDKDIEKFNQGIKRILEDKESDAYHFEGFFFPSSIDFSNFEFKKDVFFTEAEFTGKLTNFSMARFSGEDVDFGMAEFSGENADFSQAEFSGTYTDFMNTRFSAKTIIFCEAKFLAKFTNFMDAEFQGVNTDFSNTEFSGETINFSDSEFGGKNTDFHGAEFWKGNTDFSWACFSAENTNFSEAQFSGKGLIFNHAEFSGRILFHGTVFNTRVNFTRVDLRKCIFTDVDLQDVEFTLIDWDWKCKLRNEAEVPKKSKPEFHFETSEIYRQLKVQFHNKRDFAKAGMFHFREQECKRMACKLPKDFFKWIFLWILKLSCGYGEKLRNVGLSSIALVLIFGIIYMFLGLHATDQNEGLILQYKIAFKDTTPIWTIIKDFGRSLNFSVKGFFPLWRFQQYKVVGDSANLVAGIEFLLGAFMVGLFVYVFRRRMEK